MKTKIPFKIISISDESFHLIIKISINGKEAKLVIDTGASHSVFDLKRIKNFLNDKKLVKNSDKTTGLGTNTMESHTIIIKKMKLKDLIILEYNAVILDLSHVNQSYASINLPEVDGVLGSDILLKYKAVIDYEKKILTLKYKKPKK